MDPALQELLEAGEAVDEVSIVVRLQDTVPPPAGLRIVARLGPIATARIERGAIWQIYGHPAIVSVKAPRWLASEYGPIIDVQDAEQVDVLESDQRRPSGIEQTGRGCVIALIDWGCDFAHPDFVSDTGVSRVRALWDQRSSAWDGNRYGYGRVLRSGDLTAAIKADDPYVAAGYDPSRSDSGTGAHGTHVLSIAAGNGRGGGPLGIAPEAELLFVHLGAPGWDKAGPLGDSANLIEALHFVVEEAGDQPLVINLSIGRHAGPHDGTTLVEQALDWLVRARPGTAVVQSTGNYYARNVHGCGQLRNGETEELDFEVHPGDTTPNELEVWYPGTDLLRAELIAPGGLVAARAAQNEKVPVLVQGVRVGTLYHRARDPNNGDHHINLFQYPNAPPGTWRLVLHGEDVSDGRYHAWLERDPGCNVCQALFANGYAVATGTTGSICNGLQTIAVGAYDAHDPAHPLARFSSSGPTRDGRVRPLLIAPGVRVLAARSQPKTGTAPLLTRMSGTSMAAPHVTGTIALMLQAAGRLTIVRIRQALFDALRPLPRESEADRHRSGFGLLDTAAAVTRAAELARPAGAMLHPAPRELSSLDAPPRRDAAQAGAASPSLLPRQAVPAPAIDAEAVKPPTEPIDAEIPQEIAMDSANCCGEKCRTCEHCATNPCDTCPCCHETAGADAGAVQDEAAGDEPLIQVVPSPLRAQAAQRGGADVEEDLEPLVQVVPSPLRPSHAAQDAEVPEAAIAVAARTPAAAGAEAAPHPVDAAEAALEAGYDDASEFLAYTLRTSGRAWPSRCTARSLFDDLTGRTDARRRLQMERLFEVIGRPGRPLLVELQAGDIVLRRGEGPFAHAALVAHPVLYSAADARAYGLAIPRPRAGTYVHVIEPGASPRGGRARFARRVGQVDGSLLPDTLVLRARAEAAEAPDAEQAAPDSNVRWLQSALNRAIGAGLVVDGLLGPATRDAVRRYQAVRGLQVDGIVGPQTLGALRNEYYAGMPPAGSTYPQPSPEYPPAAYPPPYGAPPSAYPPPPPGYPYAPPAYPPPPPAYERPSYVPPRPPAYPSLPAYPAARTPPPAYRPPVPAPPAYRPPVPTPPAYPEPAPYSPGDDAGDQADDVCVELSRFGYDSAALTAAHLPAIAEAAQRIAAGGVTHVSITGYASPEGTPSYNLALGQRRAESVSRALRRAIDAVRPGATARIHFQVGSEGEARQVSADGPANRRVVLCYTEAPAPVPVPPRPTPRPPPRPPVTRTLTRYSVESVQGQAMLQRYAEAVRRMKALPESNPLSWTFQWYTHWVRSDRTKAAEIARVFGPSASPARALAERMWESCRAHGGFQATDELFFLPWHRMYVYYFERICRSVLQDDSFTLPYWNYTSGSTRLPAPLRDPSSPLFSADRNPGPNQGRPIDEGQAPGTVSAQAVLRLRNYAARGSAPGFNESLDQRPHGVVHGLVGNNRGMGTVPWAAQDPVFWLHHCNIDRVWASWNAAGRSNPSDSGWLDRSFPFADENGQAVTATTRDFADIAARGYRYDSLESVPAPAPAEVEEAEEPDTGRRAAMATRKTAAPPGGIPLGANAIKVNLRGETREGVESDETSGRARRVYLVLRNYRANVQPGVIYHVYLGLPPGVTGQAAQRHYVGPISFFDAVPLAGHDDSFVGRTARFDVTAIATRLRGSGHLGASPSVTIAPAGEPASNARPLIGEISLVEE
jgi:subtilisin family serine protease/outer membrane protein OmpA-like peptidoglycan-associated protein